jgi:rod shape determining protein RodA
MFSIRVFKRIKSRIDWPSFFASLFLVLAGLVTMYSFAGDNLFFNKQIIWSVVAIFFFFGLSLMDLSFLKRPGVLISLFFLSLIPLLLLLFLGEVTKGAQSWIDLGFFRVQPSDPAKLVLILILAKYFSRRHIEIRNIRHILVSAFYTLTFFTLILLQPDFGSAVIIGMIWICMILISGISKRHLLAVFLLGIVTAVAFWFFAFENYQRVRLLSFLNPTADLQGSGYNAHQSVVAIGSGQLLGKGVGFGSQSRLRFLPEYETDFIFAAFAEEWGFWGVLIILSLFSFIIWRILYIGWSHGGNFETLFASGLAAMLASHALIHIGMNAGLLPVTGTPLPFMSYGGSHILTEFAGLGILSGLCGATKT